MKRLLVIVAAVLLVVLPVFGTAETEPDTAQVEINIWHPFGPSGHPGGGEFFEKLVAEFSEMHPDVIINSTLHGVLEMRQKMQIALPAGTQPTMWFGGPAAATLGQYAEAGYVANLTPYYEQYGWEDVSLEKGLQYISYNGQYYGVAHNPDLVVVYYNKDMFASNGWSVPNTFEEFSNLIEAALAKGLAPIAFGNRDAWPGVNFMTVMLDFQEGARKHYEQVLFGNARWDVPEFIAGAELLVQLNEMGAFNRDINALSAYDASLSFATGESAMFIQGTWQMAGVVADASFEAGMFLLPTDDPGRPRATAASYGPFFSVSAEATQAEKDLAAEFINYILFENAERWYEETSIAPSQKLDLAGIDFYHPLAKERAELVVEYLDHAVFDLHTAPPRSISSNHMYAGIQALLDGKIDPEAFFVQGQELGEIEKAAGNHWQP